MCVEQACSRHVAHRYFDPSRILTNMAELLGVSPWKGIQFRLCCTRVVRVVSEISLPTLLFLKVPSIVCYTQPDCRAFPGSAGPACVERWPPSCTPWSHLCRQSSAAALELWPCHGKPARIFTLCTVTRQHQKCMHADKTGCSIRGTVASAPYLRPVQPISASHVHT